MPCAQWAVRRQRCNAVRPDGNEGRARFGQIGGLCRRDDTGFFDKAGNSIKAPRCARVYFRHLSDVQVAKYVGDQWLVTFITDDYNTTC